jgi:hypothetical protein
VTLGEAAKTPFNVLLVALSLFVALLVPMATVPPSSGPASVEASTEASATPASGPASSVASSVGAASTPASTEASTDASAVASTPLLDPPASGPLVIVASAEASAPLEPELPLPEPLDDEPSCVAASVSLGGAELHGQARRNEKAGAPLGTTGGAVRCALWSGHGRSPAPARHGRGPRGR